MKKIDKLRDQHTVIITGQVAGLSDDELDRLALAEIEHPDRTRPSVLQSVWREKTRRERIAMGHGA